MMYAGDESYGDEVTSPVGVAVRSPKPEPAKLPTFPELMERAREEVGDDREHNVERRYWCAWWYAAGVDDHTGTRKHADGFAVSHASQAIDFEAGRRSSLPSIFDAYRAYVEAQP